MKLISILKSVLLLERFINVKTVEEKNEYIDIIWDMMQKAYAPIGGFKSATDKQDLINKTDLWKLVRKDGKIVAASLYKDKSGRKSIASAAELGSDGKATKAGKDALLSIIIEDIKMNRSWSEVSGAMEHLKIKHGAIKIPNKFASQLLNKEILSYDDDGYHYTRLIGGKPHSKMIVGYVEGLNI